MNPKETLMDPTITDPASLVVQVGRTYGWRCPQCPDAGTGGYDTAEDAENGAEGHVRNAHPYALFGAR